MKMNKEKNGIEYEYGYGKWGYFCSLNVYGVMTWNQDKTFRVSVNIRLQQRGSDLILG